jgi:hypothetical protein
VTIKIGSHPDDFFQVFLIIDFLGSNTHRAYRNRISISSA